MVIFLIFAALSNSEIKKTFHLHFKKVKELTDKRLGELELGHVRLAVAKVKCPHKLDISVLYQLTRRLPHEDGVALARQVGPSKL